MQCHAMLFQDMVPDDPAAWLNLRYLGTDELGDEAKLLTDALKKAFVEKVTTVFF
jgi:hypothetical protein